MREFSGIIELSLLLGVALDYKLIFEKHIRQTAASIFHLEYFENAAKHLVGVRLLLSLSLPLSYLVLSTAFQSGLPQLLLI